MTDPFIFNFTKHEKFTFNKLLYIHRIMMDSKFFISKLPSTWDINTDFIIYTFNTNNILSDRYLVNREFIYDVYERKNKIDNNLFKDMGRYNETPETKKEKLI